MEQTFGITYEKFKTEFRKLIRIFVEANYSVSWEIVKFQGWGLTQTRKRLILLAAAYVLEINLGLSHTDYDNRPGETLPKITPYTHSAEPDINRLKPYNTVGEV